MEDVAIVLERHEQKIKKLEEEFSDLRAVQEEIKSMNKALITLTAELKHTNEHLAKHDVKIDEIEKQPKIRLQQIATAIISALSGALITTIISFMFAR